MVEELEFTSTQNGLEPGASGYCTVARTRGVAKTLQLELEALSSYWPSFPPGSPEESNNPPNYAHRILLDGRRQWHVISRICYAGRDYTGRNNHFCHHVLFPPEEAPQPGPAWLASREDFLHKAWNGRAEILEQSRNLPPDDGCGHPRVCRKWETMTGDAGWAGHLVEKYLEDPSLPCYIVYDIGQAVLPLLQEALALLPARQRWGVTFCTYYKSGGRNDCGWRCVLSASPDTANVLSRADPERVFDVRTRGQTPAPTTPWATYARTGLSPAPIMTSDVRTNDVNKSKLIQLPIDATHPNTASKSPAVEAPIAIPPPAVRPSSALPPGPPPPPPDTTNSGLAPSLTWFASGLAAGILIGAGATWGVFQTTPGIPAARSGTTAPILDRTADPHQSSLLTPKNYPESPLSTPRGTVPAEPDPDIHYLIPHAGQARLSISERLTPSLLFQAALQDNPTPSPLKLKLKDIATWELTSPNRTLATLSRTDSIWYFKPEPEPGSPSAVPPPVADQTPASTPMELEWVAVLFHNQLQCLRPEPPHLDLATNDVALVQSENATTFRVTIPGEHIPCDLRLCELKLSNVAGDIVCTAARIDGSPGLLRVSQSVPHWAIYSLPKVSRDSEQEGWTFEKSENTWILEIRLIRDFGRRGPSRIEEIALEYHLVNAVTDKQVWLPITPWKSPTQVEPENRHRYEQQYESD